MNKTKEDHDDQYQYEREWPGPFEIDRVCHNTWDECSRKGNLWAYSFVKKEEMIVQQVLTTRGQSAVISDGFFHPQGECDAGQRDK